MEVEITQYLMPDGRNRKVTCEVPDDLHDAYQRMKSQGRRLACEMLSTGDVSVTIEDGSQDYDIEICFNNGPGENNPPAAVGKLLRRSMANTEASVTK